MHETTVIYPVNNTTISKIDVINYYSGLSRGDGRIRLRDVGVSFLELRRRYP